MLEVEPFIIDFWHLEQMANDLVNLKRLFRQDASYNDLFSFIRHFSI